MVTPNNSGPAPVPYRLIDTPQALTPVLTLFRKCRALSLDIESNSFYRYRESTCLIQAATHDSVWIIDPLALRNLSPLGDVLSDPGIEKIFHNADYDLRSLDRDYGFRVHNIFDTSVAAAFLGLRTLGLDRVLEAYLDVKVEKHKSIQRSNWGRRPLPDAALNYAAQDVVHLFPLRNTLSELLGAVSRLDWVKEEFERLEAIRHTPPSDRESGWRDVKGIGKLTPGQKSVFRKLHAFRDQEARRKDRPPCKVLPNDILFRLAVNPDDVSGSLPGMPRNAPSEFLSGLRKAIEQGLALPPYREAAAPSLPREEQARIRDNLKQLKEWRARTAEPLGLDPPLIWPTRHLEVLARAPEVQMHNPLDDLGRPMVRSWQIRLFSKKLREAVRTLRP